MKENPTSQSRSIMMPQGIFDRLLNACAMGNFTQAQAILAEAAPEESDETIPLAKAFRALADIHQRKQADWKSIREALRKLANGKSGPLCRESFLTTLDDLEEVVSAKEIEALKAWTLACLACGVHPEKYLHDLDPYLVGRLDELQRTYGLGAVLAPEVVERIAGACMTAIESELSESEMNSSSEENEPPRQSGRALQRFTPELPPRL